VISPGILVDKASTQVEDMVMTISYFGLHKRVSRARGPASAHQCVRCPAQAAHWATVHGETGTDIWADYVPMCVSCHRKYDGAGDPNVWQRAAAHQQTKTHCPAGHLYSDENTFYTKAGYRRCLPCHRDRNRRWRQSKREVMPG